MPCCHGQNYDSLFDAKIARKELRAYRSKGPRGATARLLQIVKASTPPSPSLLDIGGGVGVIPQEMLKAGASQITSVDASEAYHATTESVAREQGFEKRWNSTKGDFVECSADISPADIVTLDKVICCYPDMPALVGASATKAEKIYGIVIPKDEWWVRSVAKIGNLILKVLRYEFRGYVHRHAAIDAVIEKAGLRKSATASYWFWSIRLYTRTA